MTAAHRFKSSRASSADTTGLIRAVKAAVRARGMDDDLYRDMLQAQTGKRSAKLCNAFELRKVLDHLNGAAKPTGRKRADTPVAKKARALWLSLYALGAVQEPSETALNAWVKAQYGVEDLAFLPAADSFAVVEGLKQWAARKPYLVNWKLNKDPRRCIIDAQWCRLRAAGIPEIELSTEVYNGTGVVSVALSTGTQLDKMIDFLGRRVRALPKGE